MPKNKKRMPAVARNAAGDKNEKAVEELLAACAAEKDGPDETLMVAVTVKKESNDVILVQTASGKEYRVSGVDNAIKHCLSEACKRGRPFVLIYVPKGPDKGGIREALVFLNKKRISQFAKLGFKIPVKSATEAKDDGYEFSDSESEVDVDAI